MRNEIIVKSDASKKSDWGVGLAFDATIYRDRDIDKMKGQKYVEDGMKTSEAEFQAAAHAVEKIYDEMDGDVEDFRLIVESDHTGTADRINDGLGEGVHERVFWYFADCFDSFEARWIPRHENEAADALAKNALRNGYENND